MNKRHYEHTLPNIRGSLSNTYGDQQEISLEFPANLPEERIQIVVDSYNSPLP